MHSSAFTASLLACLPLLAQAWNAPSYSGFNLVWSDSFSGSGNTLPDQDNWNIITGNLGVNQELETYSDSTANVQLSGGNTLQLVPVQASDGSWTSGRVESRYTFTPAAGAQTLAEADIRFGSNDISNKQGMWPAFWMLGDSIHQGTSWPECGEIDALETINGQLTGHGTVHCDQIGGVCNDPGGIGSQVTIPDQEWHTWRVQFDRTSNDWQSETITFYMDGNQFGQVTGSGLNDENSWNALCHSPLFFILNVAVGGSWPGDPNSSTEGGYGSMMEVAYVAVYST
ncbi:hypothetical protein SEPCBS57363_004786 [Sporothrix epigloea]|uniref:GH16 domain-containing protein n=1 Tax=Sporothrix epigloea TaxID=1892477 RepID=A0ABP0DTX4_9PEZI